MLEPLSGYLRLAEQLLVNPALAGAWNFGPPAHQAATVRDVIDLARATFGQGEVEYGDGTEGPHEAGLLALETARARIQLGIEPRWSLGQSVAQTLQWYRRFADGRDPRQLCYVDMAAYEVAA